MQCPETKANGEPCANTCQHGKPFCASHNPDMRTIRKRTRGQRARALLPGDLASVDRQIAVLKVQIAVLGKKRASLLRKLRNGGC